MATADQTARALGYFSLGLGAAELVAPGWVARLIGMRPGRLSSVVLRAFGAREIVAAVGVLGQQRPALWLWARVGGDALDLAATAAALVTNQGSRPRLAATLVGLAGVTALDMQTAEQLTGARSKTGLRIVRGITINRSREDVERFWQDFAHRSDVAPELRSARFVAAPGGRGTEIHIDVHHDAPAFPLLAALSRVLGSNPVQRVQADLRRAKQLLEAGEVTVSAATRDGAHLFQDPAQPPAGTRV